MKQSLDTWTGGARLFVSQWNQSSEEELGEGLLKAAAADGAPSAAGLLVLLYSTWSTNTTNPRMLCSTRTECVHANI